MAFTDYSTTPANNNSAPPNGAPEGMAAAAVNDTIRQIMADLRAGVDAKVTNVALMTALLAADLVTGLIVQTDNFSVAEDGGGNRFRWDNDSTDTPDGITIFELDVVSATGRFHLINFSFLTPEMAGAKGDGTDDLTALTNWWTFCVTNNVKMITKPVTYGHSGQIYTSGTSDNIDIECYGGITTFKLLTNVTEKVIFMTEVDNINVRNVIFDLNSLCAVSMDLRNSGTNLEFEVLIENYRVKNAVQTTQTASAIPLLIDGEWQKIEVNGFHINGLSRTTGALACQALVIDGTVGVIHVHNSSFKGISSPVGQVDADAIVVFGKQSATNSALDIGTVLVENNYFEDVKGRFFKSQHSNSNFVHNKGRLTDSFDTIQNWHMADFQKGNGKCDDNKLQIGTGITNDVGGAWSGSPGNFTNPKSVAGMQSSTFNDNTVASETLIDNAVTSTVENGGANTETMIGIRGNNLETVSQIVKHEGLDAALGKSCNYVITDNTADCRSNGMTFFDFVVYTKLFIQFTDNRGISTPEKNFRPAIRQDSPFSLNQQFVIGRNKGFQDKVGWVFDSNKLQNGNDFETGSQANNNDPTTPGPGTGAHWKTSYNLQRINNSAGTITFQRTNTDVDSDPLSWNSWFKSTTWVNAD